MKSSKINRICKVLNKYDPMLLYETLNDDQIYEKEATVIYRFMADNKDKVVKEYLYDRIQFIFINYYGELLPVNMCMKMAEEILSC